MSNDITPEAIGTMKISGIDYFINSLSFNAGNYSRPASISARVVSESGRYPVLPAPSGTTIKDVEIGDFSIKAYLTKRSVTKNTSGGKVMELSFVDTSIELDRYYIGLLNKMGTKSQGNLIIVGTEIDPCEDSGLSQVSDPCNPCPDRDEDERFIQCNKERRLSILDVEYSFNDLLDKLPFPILSRPETDDSYKSNYTGPLRGVLSSWCSDYGYTFYWDNGFIKFIDINKGIPIDTSSINDRKILQRTDSVSIENSSTQGISMYFGAQGEEKNYDCSSDNVRRVLLRPIRLDDIIDPNLGIMQYYGSFTRLQAMIGMSVYSPDLRDNYTWYIKEGITTPAAAEAKINKKMPLLGNMEITAVYHAGSTTGSSIYDRLLTLIPADDPLKDLINKKAYFFKAKRDDDLLSKYSEFESRLGTEFLGRHFVRRFKSVYQNGGLSWLSPDGDSVSFYRRTDPFQFAFSDIIPDSTTKFSTYLEGLRDEDGEAATSFVYLERNTQWYPALNSLESEKLSKDMSKIVIRDMGVSNVGEELEEDERFFMAFEKPEAFVVKDFVDTDHFLDKENVNISVEVSDYLTHYGLRSAGTKSMKVRSPNNINGIDITFPAQSIVGTNNSGYMVVLSYGSSSDISYELDKKEITYLDGTEHNGALSFNINFKDETNNVTRYLESAEPSSCNIKNSLILSELQSVGEQLKYETPLEFEESSFIINGLPPNATTSQGLDSMNIRKGLEGVETSLSFSNKNALPISRNLLEHRFEEAVKYNYLKQNRFAGATSAPKATSIPDA